MSYIIRKVFESTFRNRFSVSVCTAIFKRIAGLCFYCKSLMLCYTSMDSYRRSLQTNGKLSFKFQIRFWINGRKPKNIQTNSVVWILIKVQCVIYQWVRLDKLYKLMENFFLNFGIIFRINYLGFNTISVATIKILQKFPFFESSSFYNFTSPFHSMEVSFGSSEHLNTCWDFHLLLQWKQI